MFFVRPVPAFLRLWDEFTGSFRQILKILRKPPKIPGFSIFRVVCKHSTGIILKDTCAKVDTELHDRKSTANTVFDIQESNEGRNL